MRGWLISKIIYEKCYYNFLTFDGYTWYNQEKQFEKPIRNEHYLDQFQAEVNLGAFFDVG
jgi:hypothetical protein